MNDLDAINSKINLVQIAEQAGSRLRKAGNEWRGNCPIHGGDNNTGFAIYDNGTRWTCFTGDCGSGDALGFIMKHRRVGLLKAIEIATNGVPLTPEEVTRINLEQAKRASEELERQIEKAQTVLKELNESEIWLRYHEQLLESEPAQKWWEKRGIPRDYQNFWQLGYSPDRRIWIGEEIHTPTATIPIFGKEWAVENVKHRLIGNDDRAGKYRYEYSNLKAPPYLCNPDKENTDTVVLVEGEIKAMVTFLTLDEPDWQVIGMPGKGSPVDRVKPFVENAGSVFVCCDPDTGKLNETIAYELGAGRCRIVDTPMKIDDYILMTGLKKKELKTVFNQSRRVR